MLDGRGSIPGGGEIFHIRPEKDWGPPNLLYNGYRFLPGGKSAGARRSPPTLLWAELYENRIPAVDEIFHARRNRNCGFLFIGYRDFPRGKATAAWRGPETPSTTEFKEIVELYLHSPVGLSGLFNGEF